MHFVAAIGPTPAFMTLQTSSHNHSRQLRPKVYTAHTTTTMGAGSSKTTPDQSQHVFAAYAPAHESIECAQLANKPAEKVPSGSRSR